MTAEIIQFIPRTKTPTLLETEELKVMEFLRHAPELIVRESDLDEAIWRGVWLDNLA
jgi:DNA-binding winged helix-turn-helix (wHTH) protein